jgi:hypothetical protein
MPTTVIESIAVELIRRLEEITIDNDYTFDAYDVVRPDRTGVEVNPVDSLIVIKQGKSTRNTELDMPGNPPALAYETPFEIECFVRLSDKAENEYQEIQSDRGAQIIKAITTEATDAGRWFSFGEKATNTELGDIENFEVSEGNHCGVTVAMTVTHRQDENNPYNARS